VLVAEVVAQKLAGAAEIRVEIEDAGEAPSAAPAAPGEPAAERSVPPPVAEPRRDGPPAGALDRGRRDQAARLVRLLPGGVEETEYPLEPGGAVTVGRRACDAAFPDDDALADLHAAVTWGADGPEVRDEGGATGVFLRARAGEHTPLDPGAVVRAGRQFLVLGTGGLRHYDATGREVGRHPVGERAAILGRDAPDVVLDAADPSLSRRHLAVSERDGRVWIKDLKSVNGTWVKVRGTAPLADGDELKIGRQTFRLALGGGERERPSSVVFPARRPEPPPEPAEPPAAPGTGAAPAAAPATAGPSVTFHGTDQTFPVAAGQTLCDVAEANGVAINAECHAGICGSDPIRVVSGAEHLGPLDPGESETLEELCELDPGRHRLACMCKVTGPVVVEIVERS
jgi:ferredoxin/pSer/pThr/pTyr-binding forkhead associated (FHA) protein